MKSYLSAIFLFVVIFTLSGCDDYASHTQGTTAGNSMNGGLVAMCENRIYFANPQSGWRLYSMNHDGSDMVRLNDIPTQGINVVDGEIYYTVRFTWRHEYAIYFGSIFRMNTNGSNNQEIHSNNYFGGWISELIVLGNQIFFDKPSTGTIYFEPVDGGLFAIQTNGNNKRTIASGHGRSMNIVGTVIYFMNNEVSTLYGNLFRVGIDGRNLQQISDVRVFSLIVYGDRIYATKWVSYEGERRRILLYSMDLNGGDLQRVSEYSIGIHNIANNQIFFIREDSRNLYRMNLDGSDKQRLSDYHGWNVFILGDEIFFYASEKYEMFDETMLFRMNFDGSNKRRVI